MLDFLLLIVIAAAIILVFRVLTAKKPGNTAYKSATGIALATAFILFWINGAVGIIGDSTNDANMMYAGVLAVGIVGSIIARFQPHGMAGAMSATAVAQVLVAVIALIGDLGPSGPIWPRDILGATTLFATLWIASAWLFRSAAREQLRAGAGPGSYSGAGARCRARRPASTAGKLKR